MTAQNGSDQNRTSSASFPGAVLVCFSYAVLGLLVLHVLRPDYTPVDHMISDYAVGRYGWVMTTVFLALSAGCLSLMLGLFRDGPKSIVARLGVLLLGVASIGLVVTSIFPTDLEGAPDTHTGNIHTLTFFINIGSIFLATVLLAIGFGMDSRWRSYRRTAVALTLLVVAAFLFQFLTLHKGAPYGIANRCFLAALLVWFFATSLRLRATSARTSE